MHGVQSGERSRDTLLPGALSLLALLLQVRQVPAEEVGGAQDKWARLAEREGGNTGHLMF